MDKNCGATRVQLQAGPVAGISELRFVQADGTSRVAAKPPGLAEYEAVGLACVKSRYGDDYIVVQYGALDGGCSFCEWFALYDADGQPLTRHEPAIVEDAGLPPAQRQSPNNAEYEAVIARLGIPHPEVDSLE